MLLSNLVYRRTGAHQVLTVPMRTTLRVWKLISTAVADPNTVSPHTHLWGNPQLPHFYSIPDPGLWHRYGIAKLQHIMPAGRLLTFPLLKSKFGLPSFMLFCYLQLKHAAQAQFPTNIILAPNTAERFLVTKNADCILSLVYLRIASKTEARGTRLFSLWKEDIVVIREIVVLYLG